MPTKPDEPPFGRTVIHQARGKPVYCVNDSNGQPVQSSKPVAFLAWDKSTSRFYAVPSKPKVYLGRDLDEAVWRFRQWVLDHDAAAVTYQKTWIPTGKAKEILRQLTRKNRDEVVLSEEFPETEAWSFVRKQILDNPTLAAKKLAIPEIARLASLPRPQPTITLSECLKLYQDKRRRITHEEQKKTALAWKSFTASVKPASTLEEATDQLIDKWADDIYLPYDDGGSARTLCHKIQRVTKVFRYVRDKKGRDVSNCNRVLDLVGRIELPEADGNNPNPLKVAEWRSMIEKAKGSQWEPMLVTMLNCCFYGCDIRRLPLAVIDFDQGCMVFDRRKKQTPRVAVLWDRTLDLLRAWLRDHPTTSTVFLTQYASGYSAQGLRNAFRRFRNSSGLSSEITLNRVRDSAYTAAITRGADVTQAQILAGHRVPGKTDAYVRRNPRMVAAACEAIRKEYGIK